MNDHLTCPNCAVSGYLRKRASMDLYTCMSCGTLSLTSTVINNRTLDDGSEEVKD